VTRQQYVNNRRPGRELALSAVHRARQSWLSLALPVCFFFFFTLVTGPRRSFTLKLCDTRVYAPQIRARLGTTSHFCKVVVAQPLYRTLQKRKALPFSPHGWRADAVRRACRRTHPLSHCLSPRPGLSRAFSVPMAPITVPMAPMALDLRLLLLCRREGLGGGKERCQGIHHKVTAHLCHCPSTVEG